LQAYLNRAFKVFFAKERYGIQQSDILRVAYQYDDLISMGERPALEERLSEIRGNIARKVSEGTRPSTLGMEPRTITIGTAIIASEVKNVDKHISIGNVGGSITGSIGIDSPITSSFNRIQNSDASEELKNNLTELTAAVAEMCKRLPEKQAEAAARDLQTLTEEATSDSPRKKILEVIGDSLSSIAESIEQYGAPVMRLVAAVLTLF
jgi:hypothetical protein